MKYLYLFTILSLFFAKGVLAQNNRLINVDFQQARIEQVVTDLESKTGYRFYYDAAVFDSLRVTLQLNQQPLTRVLDEAFKNTRFKYTITSQQEVLLTKDRVVETGLANGFFGIRDRQVQPASVVPTSPTDQKEEIAEATVENKTYEIGFKTNQIGAGNATIAGYVKDAKTGETIVGASLYVTDTKSGVASDQFGFFSLTMPKGNESSTLTN